MLIFNYSFLILKVPTNETTTLHLTMSTRIVLINYNNNNQHLNKTRFSHKVQPTYLNLETQTRIYYKTI